LDNHYIICGGGARKKSSGGLLKLAVEKLFKVSQNRPIIELFKFFGWTTTPFCRNLDHPKPKININLYKISQNRPMIVKFFIFRGGLMKCSITDNMFIRWIPYEKTHSFIYICIFVSSYTLVGRVTWPSQCYEDFSCTKWVI